MSTIPLLLEWRGQRLWISPERCLFWEEQKMLILSDLHIGKSAHFRKAGIAVPQQIFQEDMHRLYQQIHQFNPDRILITGDLFHSSSNIEHDVFARWRESLGTREMILVRGNHDRLDDAVYKNMGVRCVGEKMEVGDFIFMHQLPQEIADDKYYFTGHQHPGIKLSGKGKQSVTLPCFYFSAEHAVLPAFSYFSGKHLVEPQKLDRLFAVLKDGNQSSIIDVPF
jgi:DNA ligase-associated metallophosphoesterase